MGKLGASHHTMVQVEIVVPSNINETKEMIPDYGKADFRGMRANLDAIDWQSYLNDFNTEDSWILLKGKVTELIEESIPKKLRRDNSKPLWVKCAEKCDACSSLEEETLETIHRIQRISILLGLQRGTKNCQQYCQKS